MTKTEVDYDEFRRMHLDYVSMNEICAHFGIGKEHFREVRNELGLAPRKMRCNQRKRRRDTWLDLKRWDKSNDELFRQMYLDGVKMKVMCDHFGFSSRALYRVRDRLNLEPRKQGMVKNGLSNSHP